MLIGQAGFRGSQLNALLGAGVHVPDHFCVSRGDLIEFVDPVPDGLHMPPHVLLGGKWVHQERSQAGLFAVPEVRIGGRLTGGRL